MTGHAQHQELRQSRVEHEWYPRLDYVQNCDELLSDGQPIKKENIYIHHKSQSFVSLKLLCTKTDLQDYDTWPSVMPPVMPSVIITGTYHHIEHFSIVCEVCDSSS